MTQENQSDEKVWKISEEKIRMFLEADLDEPDDCPYCCCPEVEGGSLDVEGGRVYQDMVCLECEGEWHVTYERADMNPGGR